MSYLRSRYGLGDEGLVAASGKYSRNSTPVGLINVKRPADAFVRGAPSTPPSGFGTQTQPAGGTIAPTPGSGGAGFTTGTQPAGGSVPAPTGNGNAKPGYGVNEPRRPSPTTRPSSGGGRLVPGTAGAVIAPVIVNVTVVDPRNPQRTRGGQAPVIRAPIRSVVTDIEGNSVPVEISPSGLTSKSWLWIAALVGGAYLLLSDKGGTP